MQEVGNVQGGGCARVQNTTSPERSDDDQVRHGSGGTIALAPIHAKVTSSPDIRLARKTGFAEEDVPTDRSSEKLKDTLLTSFVDWFSEHSKMGSSTPEMSIASEGKPVEGMSWEIVAARTVDRMASEIASDSPTSLLVQANVTQDAALHLLAAGALAETIQEPGQKLHTLFDADYMDVRTKVAKMPHGPI